MTLSLVLLPGLDGTGILFEPFLKSLPESIAPRVVAYPLDRPLQYAELLPFVRDALPKHEAFALLGESFSGPLALMAAAEHPEGLVAVILCASFIKNPVPLVPPWARVLSRPFLFRFLPLFAQIKALLGGYSTQALRTLLARALSQERPAVLAARVQAVLAVNVEAELRACAVPILYLAGASDRVVPRKNLREIQRVKPEIRSVTIPAPHLVLQTRPLESSRAITGFVSSLKTKRSGGNER